MGVMVVLALVAASLHTVTNLQSNAVAAPWCEELGNKMIGPSVMLVVFQLPYCDWRNEVGCNLFDLFAILHWSRASSTSLLGWPII